eukprot:9579471-Alexandrium_andersonii.AAC.1
MLALLAVAVLGVVPELAEVLHAPELHQLGLALVDDGQMIALDLLGLLLVAALGVAPGPVRGQRAPHGEAAAPHAVLGLAVVDVAG